MPDSPTAVPEVVLISRYEYESTQRPSVVTAASVLLYVFAAYSVVVALFLFGAANDTTHPGVVRLIATFMLVLGLIDIVLATMILRGSNGARVTTIVLMTISVVLDLVSFSAGSIVSIGLALLVIGLLAWNRDARDYFREYR